VGPRESSSLRGNKRADKKSLRVCVPIGELATKRQLVHTKALVLRKSHNGFYAGSSLNRAFHQ